MASNHNRQRQQRLTLASLTAAFDNGQYVNLDIQKVQVVDKDTGKPLFQEALEQQPAALEAGADVTDKDNYVVQFDTPEGKMEYVKKGTWSGIRPVK